MSQLDPDFRKILHPSILQLLETRGIEKLYPIQWEAVQIGLKSKNLLVSIPTAAGKTLIAEILALEKLLSSKGANSSGKILYLCPLKALANEKFRTFSKDWEKLGIKIGLGVGQPDSYNYNLFKNDLILLTNEKADSLLRFRPSLLKKVRMVIVDEIHLLTDESRGVTLEILLTRLQALNPKAQIIGLSATIQNSGDIARWLNGDAITSTWRPVELREGFYFDGELHFNDQTVTKISKIKNRPPIELLALDTLKVGGQVLVFANSRASSMKLAKTLALPVSQSLSNSDKAKVKAAGDRFSATINDNLVSTKSLDYCIKHGTAFHHAGLDLKQLDLIVEEFNAHNIKIICCTPTLAAGVNTPARRVIINSIFRFTQDKGMQPIPIMEYKQMAGRAGRPGYDPYGEVVILCRNTAQAENHAIRYISGEVETIVSQLGKENTIENHILALISTKTAQTKAEIVHFLQKSLYYHQVTSGTYPEEIREKESYPKGAYKQSGQGFKKPMQRTRNTGRGVDPLNLPSMEGSMFMSADELYEQAKTHGHGPTTGESHSTSGGKNTDDFDLSFSNRISGVLKEFTEGEFIHSAQPLELDGSVSAQHQSRLYEATELGMLTTRLYLPASDVSEFRLDFEKARQLHDQNLITLSPISWLYAIVKKESIRKPSVRKAEIDYIKGFLNNFRTDLIEEPLPDNFYTTERWNDSFKRSIKTTMILRDWIDEVDDDLISERYNIGLGDVRRLVENTRWLSRAISEIGTLFLPKAWTVMLKQLQIRIRYGVKPKLIPLIKFKRVGRKRARMLYASGLKTPSDIATANSSKISSIPSFGKVLAKDLKAQAERMMNRKKKSTVSTVSETPDDDPEDMEDIVPIGKFTEERSENKSPTGDAIPPLKPKKKSAPKKNTLDHYFC